MQQKMTHLDMAEERGGASRPQASRSLQLTLWGFWTIAVVGRALWIWAAAAQAQRPVDSVHLVLDCLLVGLLGLIVMTWVEIHAEPWRFLG